MLKRTISRIESQALQSVAIAIVMLTFIAIVGVIGFMIIEGYTLVDALYMTIITMATVGFAEVHPLSPVGKIFTVILIVFSFGIFGYVVTTVTRYVVDGIFRNYYRDSKVRRKIEKLKGHVILCGYGRNGKQSAQELAEHGSPFLIIEKSEEVLEEIRQNTDYLYLQGDATQEGVLEMASISEARALVTTLPNDADNLFVVLTARQMQKDMIIISRASDDHSDVKLKRAGATNVIMPDKIGGKRMAKLVVEPDVVEFMDYVMLQTNTGVKIEEISCNRMHTCFADKSIRDLDIRNVSGANIIGLKKQDKTYVVNPSPDTILTKDDQLFVLGTDEQLQSFLKLIRQGS